MNPSLLAGRILLFTVVIAVAVIALATDNMGLLYVLAAFPLLVLFITRPDLLTGAVVALYLSGLTLPQLPSSLSLFYVLSLLLIVVAVAYQMINSKARHRRSPSRKYYLGFALVLIVTMSFRGIGIQALDSKLWGGRPYVVLLLLIAVLLLTDVVTVSPRVWRNSLVWMCLLSILPAVADAVQIAGGAAARIMGGLVQTPVSTDATLQVLETGRGVARFATGAGVALIYLPLFLFRNPMRGRYLLVTAMFAVAGLLLAGLSGSRYSMISVITLLVIWALVQGRRLRWGHGIALAVCLFIVVTIAAVYARDFPVPVQRALSFVPFADVSQGASLDAEGTMIWRKDLWTRAIAEMPKYWLLGRGFAFNPRELMEIWLIGKWHRDWALVTGSYHNGILSLLLNLGAFGFLFGLGLLASTVVEHYRLFKQRWQDESLARMHRLAFAVFVNQVILYLTLGGDVQNYYPLLIFQAIILNGLAKTKEQMEVRLPQPSPADAAPAPAIQAAEAGPA